MFTLIMLRGKTPKYSLGVFPSKAEAEAWAKQNGWGVGQYLVVPHYP